VGINYSENVRSMLLESVALVEPWNHMGTRLMSSRKLERASCKYRTLSTTSRPEVSPAEPIDH
jgi:hypothetical protein